MTDKHLADVGADGWKLVAHISALPPSGLLATRLPDGEAVCIVKHGGAVYALSDRCTHEEFSLSEGEVLSDGSVECAWHGARFDCRTGAVRQGPACLPVATYAVRVEGDEVYVGRRRDRGER